jgi:hypothetical protein
MGRLAGLGKREFRAERENVTEGSKDGAELELPGPVRVARLRDMETRHPAFVPKTWALPEAIRRRLGDEAGRQRLMDEDGHLLLILHAPPKSEHDELRYPVVFWRNPEGEWKSAPAGGGLSALHGLMAEYKALAGALDEQAEGATTAREYYEVMREVNPLQRSSRNMLGVMEELRKARPHEHGLIVLRDQAVSVERAVEMVINDARTGLDFTVAESGERQAREAREATVEAKRLNRLVAFFFPVATLAGIFGMNEPLRVMGMDGLFIVILVGVLFGWFMLAFFSRKDGTK